jgi:hypothetical protein
VAEVRGRLEGELRSMGLGPPVTPGGLSVSSRAAPKAWAACRLKLVEDRTGPAPRADWAEPENLNAEVAVGLRPTDGGTEVTVIPRYAAVYIDIFRNLPVNGACPSSGVLEQRLLEAARG